MPRGTVVRDGAPRRIFKISELTRLIAGKLILFDPKGAVSLACVCRDLQDPVLSTLWQTQSSLGTLLKVLPEGKWNWKKTTRGRSEVCGMNPWLEDLNAEG